MRAAWLIGVILAAPQAEKKPAFTAGASDVTFDQSHADLCHPDELKARFRSKEDAGPYDITKEKFRVVVPKSYAHTAAWGLFVYVNAGDSPGLPAAYEPVLEKRKLLAVAAYRSGNERGVLDRF